MEGRQIQKMCFKFFARTRAVYVKSGKNLTQGGMLTVSSSRVASMTSKDQCAGAAIWFSHNSVSPTNLIQYQPELVISHHEQTT